MKRTLRHPIRGDRLHPKPPTRSACRSTWRGNSSGPRMRPRKGVNVASIVGSPEEEEARPNLRLRIVGVVVLLLFGVLVLRLWTLQVVEGKTYAAAVTRNQVRVVSVAAPRGEIVDRNGTVLVSNMPQQEILLSRAEATQNPAIVGMVAALVGQTPKQVQASIDNNQYSPYEPVPVAVGVTQDTVQFLQTHQSEYPGVSVQTVAQRTYPQQGTTATHVLGYVGDISSTFLAAHPNDGYTQGSQIGVSGIEAQYEQYLKGVPGRQALSVDASGNVVGTLSSTAPQIGDTVALNIDTGLEQYVQNALQQQILSDRQTPDQVDGGRLPPAPDGAAIVMNPQNGQVLALASFPNYDLNEWVGGISVGQLRRAAGQSRGERQRHRRPVHARLDLQAHHGHRRPPGRSHRTHHAVRRHRDVQDQRLPGSRCRRRHRLHPARRPGRHRRHLQRLERAHRVERRLLLQPGRAILGAAVEVRSDADPERGHGVRRGDHHRHRPPGRGTGSRRQLPHPGQAACRGAEGIPLRSIVVHR